jgi:penicillin-binding protein 1A
VGAKYQQKIRHERLVGSFVKRLLVFAAIVGFFGAIILGITMWVISRGLPDVETISTFIPAETTKIYSQDGVVLAELHREENRELIPIERISPILIKAVIASEDVNFYNHNGIDFKGIARAFVRNIQAGRFAEGGSTLTQQLARNLFLTRQRKLMRKISEVVLAVEIERHYTKTEILQMYLNQVYWGHNAYGIESAARLYFAKSARELNLAESALLVGLLTGPELYSPIRYYDRAKVRQKIVLNKMVEEDVITEEEAAAAYKQPLVVSKRKKLRYKAPYFVEHVKQHLIKLYGEELVYTSGMKVYTTLNYKLQKRAEEVVDKYIKYGANPTWTEIPGQKVASLNYSQAALLAIDPNTGYIIAMVGGKDFLENQFNRTIQAKRQPGSSFKPFVYLAALEQGFSPGSIVDDTPITFSTYQGPYSPQNYTQEYLGKIPMRKALEKSVNIVAIKLNNIIGPTNSVRVARTLGITSRLNAVLSLPLGSHEVTMLELTSAYGTMAAMGRRSEPTAIIRIEDRDGTPLYEHRIKNKQVYDANLMAVLVEMMQGVIRFGTGKAANLPVPVAGKTGTTSNYKDAWFIGFVPQLVCSTWVGNDDNTPTAKVTGGSVPALMWKEFMMLATQTMKPQYFAKPVGLVSVEINWVTGKLASRHSPKDFVHVEQFWSGKEPRDYDSAGDGARRGRRAAIEKDEEREVREESNEYDIF